MNELQLTMPNGYVLGVLTVRRTPSGALDLSAAATERWSAKALERWRTWDHAHAQAEIADDYAAACCGADYHLGEDLEDQEVPAAPVRRPRRRTRRGKRQREAVAA